MLAKYILTTVIYYDAMDYSMTVFEIWKYLTKINQEESEQRYFLADILEELEKDILVKYIEKYRGYYFLKGRSALYEERIIRDKIAQHKYKVLLRRASILRCAPYIRMIAVTGRLSMKHTKPQSDFDLLVVFESGKIFTGRFFLTGLTHFLGMRRHGKNIANRICLNYFITTSSLEITLKDYFSSSEYFFTLPIFGHDVFRKFQKKNGWIQFYKPNYEMRGMLNYKLLPDSYITRIVRGAGEKLLRFHRMESWLKKWQVEKIYKNPKTRHEGSMVVVNDEMLIFLPDPRGPKIYSRFAERLRKMGEAG